MKTFRLSELGYKNIKVTGSHNTGNLKKRVEYGEVHESQNFIDNKLMVFDFYENGRIDNIYVPLKRYYPTHVLIAKLMVDNTIIIDDISEVN